MKTTQDVHPAGCGAAAQGIAGEAALKNNLEAKLKVLVEKGAEVCVKA